MTFQTKSVINLILSGSLILFSTTAIAGRSYLIELVVFSNPNSGLAESWKQVYPVLNARKLGRAVKPGTIMKSFTETPAEVTDSDFSAYVARISRNPARDIILSRRWVQSVSSPATTTIARITTRNDLDNTVSRNSMSASSQLTNSATQSTPVLDGFINFYIAGQYTIEADIRYTPAYRSSILEDATSTGPTVYRIYEKRRIKSGEFNYYDHPKIGMVLRVTPVDMTKASAAAAQ